MLVLALAFSWLLRWACCPTDSSGNSFDSVPNLLKVPRTCISASLRCSCQFQGTYFCLLARNSTGRLCCDGGATSGIRPDGTFLREIATLYAWSYDTR